MDKLLKYKTKDLNVEFSKILEEEDINMIFQPIVNLSNGEILGYEALCRGPAKSPLHLPDLLFKTAKKSNKVNLLDELARIKAIEKFIPFLKSYKLFINMIPFNINDYDFYTSSTFQCLRDNGIDTSNIVLEITEQAPIHLMKNYKKFINDVKDLGIKIALDDVGSGYSGLKTILDVIPDYLKIDMDLTRDIHKDNFKRNLIKGLVTLSNNCDMKVIVEGIECREELETIMDVGAYGGQGYFLQRPIDLPEDISIESKEVFKNYFSRTI
ncbi:EAL domain-containing protein [Clostridium sp.]|uniref:EAL domain-containing protein n=1 Tax=Clostridium sp. TaxID=1506 RepID=UPI002FC75A07